MRRRLLQLVVFVLCASFVNVGAQPPSTPLPVLDYGTPPVQADWSALAVKLENLKAWYEWIETHPPTTQRKQERAVYVPSGDMASLICSVFVNNCGKAVAVATCESHLDPSAYNRSGASGLFQIMMPLHSDLFSAPGDVFDPLANTRAAFSLSRGGTSWGAWVCG